MRQPVGYVPSIKTAASARHHTPGEAAGVRRKSSLERFSDNKGAKDSAKGRHMLEAKGNGTEDNDGRLLEVNDEEEEEDENLYVNARI